MAYKLLGGGSDINTVVSDMNSNLLQLKGEEVVKVIRDEQGTRVTILDKDGLRTTAPGSGIDVVTATADQLTFNSSNNVFKIVDIIEATFPAASASTTTGFDYEENMETVAHGQNYIPLYIATIGNPPDPLPYVSLSGGSDYMSQATYNVATDATNFYLTSTVAIHANAGASRGVTLQSRVARIYILQESAV